MALPNTTVKRGQSGLGTPLPGKDHISGLVVWRDISVGSLSDPLGVSSGNFTKRYESLEELEGDGVKSDTADYKDVHYHVKEFFRLNPQGVLWLGVFDATTPNGGSPAYTEVETLQNAAGGEIRKFGVYASSAGSASTTLTFATAEVDSLQSVLDTLATNHQDATAIACWDYSGQGSGTMDQLSDVSTLSDPRVGVVISQDNANTGANLFSSLGYSITDLGAKLGTWSAAAVNESIAWVDAFPMSDGSELDVPGFGNGDANTVYSASALDTLDNNHFTFLRKFVGLENTYNSNSWTATAQTDDFATLENNVTMDKAVRDVRAFVLPNTSGPLKTNPDGTLEEDTIANYTNDAERALDPMAQAEEIASNAAGELPDGSITIDPTQDVVANSKIEVGIKLIPIGVARSIEVTIGFTTSV